jgi:hypothetical protein
MKPTRSRLVGIAAALSTIAIAAPLSTASAATAAPAFAPVPGVGAGWEGWGAGWGGSVTGLPFAQGAFALGATVVGPVIITTAPSTFINTNNQVSAGSNFSGGQFGP